MNSEIKAITSIPGWLESLSSTNKVDDTLAAYSVPLVYRAVKIRCNSLARVPVYLMRGNTQVDWNTIFQSDLTDLLWRTEAALLLRGMSVWRRVMNAPNGRILKDLQWLNPYAVTVSVDRKTNQLAFDYTTMAGIERYSQSDVVYIRSFNPGSDYEPGISEAEVSLISAQLSHYLGRFAALFFEGGAMPVTILGLDSTSANDTKRVENFFKRVASGIANAFGVIALSKAVDIKTVTPPLKDLAIPDLRNQAVENIAWAFGIPKTLLVSEAANYATADTEYTQYMQETVVPECNMIAGALNKQLFRSLGYELQFRPEEMSMFQEDEEQRAGALLQLVNAGMGLEMAMAVLGYDIPEGMTLQTSPQTANDITDDLGKWMRKALKRVKEGKNAAVPFESMTIPPVLSEALQAALVHTEDSAAVRAVFDDARTWEAYP